jgi:hypothetical protein
MNASAEFNYTPCAWCNCPAEGIHRVGENLLCFYHYEQVARTVEHSYNDPSNSENITPVREVIPESYLN